ncbi:hypothetical protein BDN72DRAFT_778820 [Pluteus cervinus]|uniref:Uncharacterized protein n=1 Tax=Pluteus cervinus TaxID=181527 RepID=A0ACD3A4X8_9AGAR|nr:hypothetical protein BDN72DRAFT_778820 [Pluteus cervinus]
MPTFTLPPILSWNTSSKSATSPDLLARVQALEAALFRLSRDHVAQQDFAYRYAGAHVIEDLTTPTPHLTTGKDHINPAFAALDDDTRVGRCWRIPGKTGQLGIELIARVMISAITVDHVPKELVFDTNHAPRDIVLWGVIDEENYGSLKAINGSAVPFPPLPHATPLIGNISTNVVPLSKFRYNTSDPNSIQTFAVSEAVISSGVAFSRVIVDIVNNWGSTWTCLYRIRIHGDVATTPLEFSA